MEGNKQFWREFIEIYRENSCLWDVNSNDYSNKTKREESYQFLVCKYLEVNKSATLDMVKKKINNLRTTLRRELKKVLEAKENGTVYQPNLWYYDLLLFVTPSDLLEKNLSINDNPVMKNEDSIHSEINIDTNMDEEPFVKYENSDTVLSDYLPAEAPDSPEQTKKSEVSALKNRRLVKRTSLGSKKLKLVSLMNNKHQTDDDEFSIIGKRLALQLKSMDKHQKVIAEKLISDVMFYGHIKKLREDASVVCSSTNLF